jgi:beta-N-acetylhexosaminidase
VTAIPQAVQRALDDGTVTDQRLRDAAMRTGELAVGRPAERADVSDLRAGGRLAEIAARCVEVVGQLPAVRRPLVLEARPPDGMASGALPWSFATALRERVLDTVAVEAHDAEQVSAALRDTDGRCVVAVVRDPALHTWQQALVAASDIVVDLGGR